MEQSTSYIRCYESVHKGPYHEWVMLYKSTPRPSSKWFVCGLRDPSPTRQSGPRDPKVLYALHTHESCCCSCKITLRSCVSLQSRKGFAFIFKALYWRTRRGTVVLCSGTEFISGFISPAELNQSCQLGNLGVSERQHGFLKFSPHVRLYFRLSALCFKRHGLIQPCPPLG